MNATFIARVSMRESRHSKGPLRDTRGGIRTREFGREPAALRVAGEAVDEYYMVLML